MPGPFRHISVEHRNDVVIVRMLNSRMIEPDLIEMADEVVVLIEDQGCRKLVFCLGPGEVACLFSVFLAKLVMIRRHITENGGAMRLAQATSNTKDVFRACDLDTLFTFVDDLDTAVAELKQPVA
jgi:hypothetical protein